MDRCYTSAAEQLVANLLDTPLNDDGTLSLRDLNGVRRLNEMAFHYPLANLTSDALNRVLEGFDGYFDESRLTFNPVKGMMKGFLDLTFEFEGRFFLADYKSNLLGSKVEDYGNEALKAAMRGHRYDLQYLIYTVALHRYLTTRVVDYDYRQHFGGVYYLFPRGMSPKQGNRYGVYYDCPDYALIDRLDRLFREGQ